MSRSHRRAASSPAQDPTTEAHPSVAAEDEDERRSRQALVDYQALTGAADPSFLLRLARAHWRVGDATSARTTVETVLRTDPDNQPARALERSLR